jgi:hypothetical protein
VHELRARGVVLEEYDVPELRTVDGIASVDGNYPSTGAVSERDGWLHDSEGNLIASRFLDGTGPESLGGLPSEMRPSRPASATADWCRPRHDGLPHLGGCTWGRADLEPGRMSSCVALDRAEVRGVDGLPTDAVAWSAAVG